MSHKLPSWALILFLYFHSLVLTFFVLGLFGFFAIDFVLYLWVLLFAFSSKIVARLTNTNSSLSFAEWEESSCGICLVYLGYSTRCSEMLWAEGRNRSRICVLFKQALMPSFFTVWIYSVLLTDGLIFYFYCIWIGAGTLPTSRWAAKKAHVRGCNLHGTWLLERFNYTKKITECDQRQQILLPLLILLLKQVIPKYSS